MFCATLVIKSMGRLFLGIKQCVEMAAKKWQLHLFCKIVHRLKDQIPDTPSPSLLFIVFGGIGDSLLCGSVFHHIKSIRKDVRIDVLTAGHIPLFLQMPSIDTLLVAPPEKLLSGKKSKASFQRLVNYLAAQGFEQAIELLGMVPLEGINSAYSGLILLASGSPVRLARKNCGKIVWKDLGQKGRKVSIGVSGMKGAANRLFFPPGPSDRKKHESILVCEALGYGSPATSDHPGLDIVDGIPGAWAEELLHHFSGGGRALVTGVNMEATYSLKAWPEERFIDVMDWGKKKGIKFIIVGLKKPDMAAELQKRLKDAAMILTGKTDLEELLALTSRLDLFFSADTGPAHIAQSYAVPTLVMFGPSNEREFGPRAQIHTAIVARRDCGKPPCVMGPCSVNASCMMNIDSEYVKRKFLQLADKASSRRCRPPKKAPEEKLVLSF